jgi:hypothetical protein
MSQSSTLFVGMDVHKDSTLLLDSRVVEFEDVVY